MTSSACYNEYLPYILHKRCIQLQMLIIKSYPTNLLTIFECCLLLIIILMLLTLLLLQTAMKIITIYDNYVRSISSEYNQNHIATNTYTNLFTVLLHLPSSKRGNIFACIHWPVKWLVLLAS